MTQHIDAPNLEDQNSRFSRDSQKANCLTVGGLQGGNSMEKSAEVIVFVELTTKKD